MKLYFLLISVLLLSNKIETQVSGEKNPVQLTISSETDTFFLGNKMTIDAAIHNKTNKAIAVPNTFSLTSNLYPNGVDQNFFGGLFNLKISPLSEWSQIFIEDLVLTKDTDCSIIRPDSSINFQIDIGNHINSFNKEIKDSSLQIKSGETYTLQLTYTNESNGNCQNLFKGKLESNTIKVFIK
jgi:hypothetical protein